MQFEKLEIHKVFLRFPNFYLDQNLSPSTLANLIIGYSSRGLWRVPQHMGRGSLGNVGAVINRPRANAVRPYEQDTVDWRAAGCRPYGGAG